MFRMNKNNLLVNRTQHIRLKPVKILMLELFYIQGGILQLQMLPARAIPGKRCHIHVSVIQKFGTLMHLRKLATI